MQARRLLTAAALVLTCFAPGAFAADGCRTIANGVQKCDVPSGQERTREQVVAEIHGGAAAAATGCRTIANGVQKCDVPTGLERTREAVVADLSAPKAASLDGCRTIANGVQKCDVPAIGRVAQPTYAQAH